MTDNKGMRIILVLLAGGFFMFKGDRSVPEWQSKISKQHPRMMFSQKDIAVIKQEVYSCDVTDTPKKKEFLALKTVVDNYPISPNPLTKDDERPSGYVWYGYYCKGKLIGDRCYVGTSYARENWKLQPITKYKEWGSQSLRAAIVYKVTNQSSYLTMTRNMLNLSIQIYNKCFDSGVSVNWYTASRINWLVALDLIWNDITPQERENLLLSFYNIFDRYDTAYSKDYRNFYHYNKGGIRHTGYYSETNLKWYMGLIGLNEGIDDVRADAYLKKGFDENLYIINKREETVADDGCFTSMALFYMWGAYPFSTYNFFYSWKAAVGEGIAKNYKHLGMLPNCVYWLSIPDSVSPMEFGLGDQYHQNNKAPINSMYYHMNIVLDLYKTTHPEWTNVANGIINYLPSTSTSKLLSDVNSLYFMHPFLFDSFPDKGTGSADKITANARYFEKIGVISMRSGNSDSDTYISYNTGSQVSHHRHLDLGHFVIYKKGYLALDSGTRGNSNDCNLKYYYQRSVAHNTILINEPSEAPPVESQWGSVTNLSCLAYPESKYEYGGQYKSAVSGLDAFETNNNYTYIVDDMTDAYRSSKASKVVRQFLYIYPDYVIIKDTVTSTNVTYYKQWLLHSQNKPTIAGNSYTINEGQGTMSGKFFSDQDMVLVGGHGKEFLSGGRNWDVESKVKSSYKYLGNWRIELRPKAAQLTDNFLVMLVPGLSDKENKAVLSSAVHSSTATQDVISFVTKKGESVIIKFDKIGCTGTIKIGNDTEKSFATTIQRQAGLNG